MIEKIIISVSWMITGIIVWELIWRELFTFLFKKNREISQDD